MATLTVWKFDDADRAEQILGQLQDLQKQGLITVHDGAIVSWPTSAKKPKTRQLANLTGAGALSGAFWGMLFGLLFFVPFLGAAMGAAMGGLAGSFADVGIDDKFIDEVRAKVTEGTSALFLLSSGGVRDKLAEALGDVHGELIHTNLSNEEEQQLREAFEV
jgi:uncharacterized membrane protein